ncbi:hypothetical protein CEXT_191361 [Caerostris extrusa]|uniref:Uncharacterized protein n=1 Tax=Caerostris extrusa TaxID=172846 RepID=A0AAV4W3M6_CAEEX|nr:hypothetical protein CEXT_191361 [Caerostris extrusa]
MSCSSTYKDLHGDFRRRLISRRDQRDQEYRKEARREVVTSGRKSSHVVEMESSRFHLRALQSDDGTERGLLLECPISHCTRYVLTNFRSEGVPSGKPQGLVNKALFGSGTAVS